jgi:hypothetical protein
MSRLSPVFASIALIASIAAAYLWQQLSAERANRSPQQGLSLVSRESPLAANAPACPSVAAADVQPSLDGSSGTKACTPTASDIIDQLMPTLRKDQRDRDRIRVRATAPHTLSDFQKVLGLSASEADALYEMVTRHSTDIASASYVGPNETFRKEAENARSEITKLQSSELQALLGPAKYQEWQEYLPTRTARREIVNLRNIVGPADPLTDSQAQLLIPALTAQGRIYEDSMARNTLTSHPELTHEEMMEASLNINEEWTRAILQSTQMYLSPQQHAIVRKTLNDRIASQRKSRETSRAKQAGTRVLP